MKLVCPVRPTTTLQVLKIKKEQFLKLISEFPELSVEMLKELAGHLKALARAGRIL